jgi:transcription initiation factor TFIIB
MQCDGTRCPECDGRCVVDGEETVCRRCGLVVGTDRIDRGPEWRAPDDGREQKRRTGAPVTRARHDRGLTTEMGPIRASGRKRRRLRRLRRQHDRTRIRSKRERNRVYGFTEIRRLADALGAPEPVRDRSCVLFGRAQDHNLLRGRTVEGFAAAAVYAACRVAEVARTTDEVVDAAKATDDEFRAAYASLNRDLNLPVRPVDPCEYLPRFADRLDLPTTVERRAASLVDEARDRGLIGGRDPGGVAGACLYAAARDADVDLTQREAASAADVTPVTVRNTYQDLSADRGGHG